MDLTAAMAKAFVIMLVTVVVFLVLTLFWVRQTVRGKNYAIFIEPNNHISGSLLKEDESGTMMVGSDEDAQKYKTIPGKQFWSFWPPGFPRFVQEPVPTYMFIRNSVDPVDPRGQVGIITAKELRIISDEAFLKTTWKDVRDSIGIGASRFNTQTIKIVVIVVVLILLAVGTYFAYQNSSQIGELLDTFKTSTPSTPEGGQ